MKKIDEYDELDIFLNRAYWHEYSKKNSSSKLRQLVLNEFITLMKINEISYCFDYLTYQDLKKNKKLKKEVFIDNILIYKKDKNKFLNLIKISAKNNFKIIELSSRKILLIKEQRILEITFTYLPFLFSFETKNPPLIYLSKPSCFS